MRSSPSYRITPWVGRLIVANSVVLLLLMTLFTSREVFQALEFSPSAALSHPWTFVSYMFVHGGLLHLFGNMLALYVFGTAVESRMGSRNFLLYYLFCGIGAAVFSLLLAGIMAVGPFVGASGAVLGVAVAFAMFWPDAELIVFPIPVPIKARTLVIGLVALDVIGSRLWPGDGIAHIAHVGGALFGYLFFRVQSLSRRAPAQPTRAVERVVMVQSGSAESDRRTPVTPMRPRRRVDSDPVAAEVDRVLDKISEKGISSLTPAERRFLDEVARKKKHDH
ncbi:MAG TPA: rhomboid family intramembrane serine protease [Gemmatimonadales bacterium]|jgi:membrane associated rhomboid family serine protease|nr:rhomboid family intramembrane serine protease [Gemmatimonadales bacterium]